jgi:hypothetical protein
MPRSVRISQFSGVHANSHAPSRPWLYIFDSAHALFAVTKEHTSEICLRLYAANLRMPVRLPPVFYFYRLPQLFGCRPLWISFNGSHKFSSTPDTPQSQRSLMRTAYIMRLCNRLCIYLPTYIALAVTLSQQLDPRTLIAYPSTQRERAHKSTHSLSFTSNVPQHPPTHTKPSLSIHKPSTPAIPPSSTSTGNTLAQWSPYTPGAKPIFLSSERKRYH